MFKRILIEGAMDEEINFLIESINEPITKRKDGFKYIEGTIGNFEVIILKTGIGEENAIKATKFALLNIEHDLIINQGTLGSHVKDIHQYDFVIATEIINPHKPDQKLVVDDLNFEFIQKMENTKGKIYFGPISSSDDWHKETKEINILHRMFGTIGEEMEGYGSLKWANYYQKPYLSIRVVSNNELTDEKYETKTAEHLQKDIIAFLKKGHIN